MKKAPQFLLRAEKILQISFSRILKTVLEWTLSSCKYFGIYRIYDWQVPVELVLKDNSESW
jgi:hypothetical protein